MPVESRHVYIPPSGDIVHQISVSETFKNMTEPRVELNKPNIELCTRPTKIRGGKNGLRDEGDPKLVVQEQNIGIGSRKNAFPS